MRSASLVLGTPVTRQQHGVLLLRSSGLVKRDVQLARSPAASVRYADFYPASDSHALRVECAARSQCR